MAKNKKAVLHHNTDTSANVIEQLATLKKTITKPKDKNIIRQLIDILVEYIYFTTNNIEIRNSTIKQLKELKKQIK